MIVSRGDKAHPWTIILGIHGPKRPYSYYTRNGKMSPKMVNRRNLGSWSQMTWERQSHGNQYQILYHIITLYGAILFRQQWLWAVIFSHGLFNVVSQLFFLSPSVFLSVEALSQSISLWSSSFKGFISLSLFFLCSLFFLLLIEML